MSTLSSCATGSNISGYVIGSIINATRNLEATCGSTTVTSNMQVQGLLTAEQGIVSNSFITTPNWTVDVNGNTVQAGTVTTNNVLTNTLTSSTGSIQTLTSDTTTVQTLSVTGSSSLTVPKIFGETDVYPDNSSNNGESRVQLWARGATGSGSSGNVSLYSKFTGGVSENECGLEGGFTGTAEYPTMTLKNGGTTAVTISKTGETTITTQTLVNPIVGFTTLPTFTTSHIGFTAIWPFGFGGNANLTSTVYQYLTPAQTLPVGVWIVEVRACFKTAAAVVINSASIGLTRGNGFDAGSTLPTALRYKSTVVNQTYAAFIEFEMTYTQTLQVQSAISNFSPAVNMNFSVVNSLALLGVTAGQYKTYWTVTRIG